MTFPNSIQLIMIKNSTVSETVIKNDFFNSIWLKMVKQGKTAFSKLI